ncbi:MAG TPA: hypothetical protein VMM13_10380 [Euzebya sp.]|nr:hypothetical protein [Euzebya sp.]
MTALTAPARTVIVIAVLLQLVVLVPFTVSSGLVAPLWAIIALGLLWLIAAAVLWQVAIRQPFATPVIPIANAVLLWAAITAGETWLGWMA